MLKGKAAVVTGGDSGIGHAIAVELGRQGASVTVNYHKNADAADATVKEIEAAGGKAQAVQGDVSSIADIQNLVDKTVAAFGRLDIMVNNAGMETRTSTLDTTEKQFDLVIAIDLKSAFFGVQLAAKQMIKQGGGGRIINISSIHEDWPMPGNSPYCAAKGGIRMLTRTAGVELAPNGITVVGVAPGAVHTPIDDVTLKDPVARAKLESAIPLGHVAEPSEIANLVAFLASDWRVLRHGDDVCRRRRDDAGERRPLGDPEQVEAPSMQAVLRPTEPVAPAQAGASQPIGATLTPDGVNVSVYAKRATAIELLLFDRVDDDVPARVVDLDTDLHRTGPYWHAFVPGVRAGQAYGFRAHGPWAPERGLRFDGDRILLDPYGRGVAVPDGYRRTAGSQGEHGPGDDDLRAMKSVVVDLASYDWEGDRPLDRPFADTVIYEAHVRGFTANPNSGVDPALRGTYAGFIEKIPYLVDLGITAVELLPVYQFDAQEAPGGHPNYWGYQPVSFFAPHGAYASRPGAQAAVDEFRDLVKALHRAGLEVILDVVYNHTAESGDDGPTFAYRGLANDEYYILDPSDRARYADYTGCGNTLNANEPVVRRLILDSLRVLGRRHARRRVPVRPRVRAVAGRGRARPFPGRRSSGTSRRTRSWLARSSSRRRGTPPGCTRSARSPATDGPSGTGGSGTTSDRSSRATRARRGRSANACSARPTSTNTSGASRRRRSTS